MIYIQCMLNKHLWTQLSYTLHLNTEKNLTNPLSLIETGRLSRASITFEEILWAEILNINVKHATFSQHLLHSAENYPQNLSCCINTVLVPQLQHEYSQVKCFWCNEYGFVNSQVCWVQHTAALLEEKDQWKRELTFWWQKCKQMSVGDFKGRWHMQTCSRKPIWYMTK